MPLTLTDRNVSHIEVFYFDSPDPSRAKRLSFRDTKMLQHYDAIMLPKSFDEFRRACAFVDLSEFERDLAKFTHREQTITTDEELNESMYGFLNAAEPRNQFPHCRKYYDDKRGFLGVRSMSVGDVICYNVDDQPKCYEVAGAGFDPIDPIAFKHAFDPNLPYNVKEER